MKSTLHFPIRSANGSTATTLCWLMLGLAGACAALPVWPEPAKTRPMVSAATPDPASNREGQRAMMFPSSADPYQAGGPGADNDTEWMPGAR